MRHAYLTAVLFRLRDERGMALPFALGVTVFLSALAAGVFTYVTTNQGAAHRARADQQAYGLAEAGLSYAFSTLGAAADPGLDSAVPSTPGAPLALGAGQVEYWGTRSGTTWTLYGRGTVTNPTGAAAANVVRTVSAQAAIVTTTTHDMRPWNYLFIDQPTGCLTLGNSVTLDIALYVRGDLCLTNTATLESPAVHILGKLYVENTATIGTVLDPIDEFRATGACHYTNVPLACGPLTHVFADTIGTNPPTIPKPGVDLQYWYDNAQLGPHSNCSSGVFPGGFDDDTTLNVSRGSVDLTPASAYDCKKTVAGETVAQLRWQPGSPGTLTIKGAIYIDGNITWTNLNLIQYDGRATIYTSGTVTIQNRADLCGVPACDATWDPRVDLLAFVAGSLISEAGDTPIGGEIGNHVTFQGAMYIVNDFEMDNNTTFWGPIISRDSDISNSANIHAPPFPIEDWMIGMPADETDVNQIQPITGSYSG